MYFKYSNIFVRAHLNIILSEVHLPRFVYINQQIGV